MIQDARWYLGLKGTLLPGKGIGIEEIDAGSPAELAGLAPGMVITHCNGWEVLAEADFPSAIEQSGGLLQLTVLENANAQPAVVTIPMQRLVTTSY